jgi:simple sugar transport system permease protein
MLKNNNGAAGLTGLGHREPLTDTNLLLTITVCIFIGMYAIAMNVWGGGFLEFQQFLNLFIFNAPLIIISCGLTIVMISGGIDISVGGVIALVTMSCAVFLNSESGSVMGSLMLALSIGLAFGLVQGYLVAYLEIQPFIITLAGMFFARGMTTIVNSEPVKVAHQGFLALHELRWDIPVQFLGRYGQQGNFIPSRIQPAALIAIGVVLVIFALLKWSRLGRNMYAVGGNNQSALMLGINVKRTKFYAHLLCGLLAGLAGFVFVMNNAAANPNGDARFFEMRAIASSIIGGTLLTGGVGNIVGTLFGSLTLVTITNIVVTSGLREPWWQQITTGALLCFFILLQSVVLSNRGKGGLALPQWLTFTRTPRETAPAQKEE